MQQHPTVSQIGARDVPRSVSLAADTGRRTFSPVIQSLSCTQWDSTHGHGRGKKEEACQYF